MLKAIRDYFPNIIMWLDAHKIYGTFIFMVCAFSFILSAYSANELEDHKDKATAQLEAIHQELHEMKEIQLQHGTQLDLLIKLYQEK